MNTHLEVLFVKISLGGQLVLWNPHLKGKDGKN